MADEDNGSGPDDEVVYELEDWPEELLDELEAALAEADIAYEWDDDGGLVVGPADADAVEALLDRLETLPGEPAPEDGELDYDVVSELFVAADRFCGAPDEPDLGEALAQATRSVEATVPPYGVDHQEWARVKGMAAAVRQGLSAGAEPDVVVTDARNLRDLLRRYV